MPHTDDATDEMRVVPHRARPVDDQDESGRLETHAARSRPGVPAWSLVMLVAAAGMVGWGSGYAAGKAAKVHAEAVAPSEMTPGPAAGK